MICYLIFICFLFLFLGSQTLYIIFNVMVGICVGFCCLRSGGCMPTFGFIFISSKVVYFLIIYLYASGDVSVEGVSEVLGM